MSCNKDCQCKTNQELPEWEKLPTFRVKGGLGKHIVFSALLPAIKAKYGRINIINAYPEVFLNNPDIQFIAGIEEYEQNKPHFARGISTIHAYEPYDTEFTFNDQHILGNWVQAYGLDPELVDRPVVHLNDNQKELASNIRKEIGDKYIIVQFSGGQSPLNFNEQQQYQMNEMTINRNYPYQMAQLLVNRIKFDFPEYRIINCSLPNEYNLMGAERIPTPFTTYFELVKDASMVICIDSMLQHVAATVDVPTIVLWNKMAWTPVHKYGWNVPNRVNIQEPYLLIEQQEIARLVREKLSKE